MRRLNLTRTAFTPAVITCCLLPVAFAGCSDGVPAALEGRVTYDGKPIANGTLRLFQLKDTPGRGAEAAIRDGRYSVELDKGLYAGRYRVEVRATKSTGPINLPDEGIPGMQKPEELRYEYIPAQYNDQSTLEVTLEPGPNQHTLELNRDPAWENEQESQFPDWIRNAIRKGNSS